jgi:diguanylate cyclase (GGDEF)-like protein
MFLCLIIVISLAFNIIVGDGFAKLESQSIADNNDKVHRLIDGNISHLETIVGDWGPWDDTYKFMLDKNSAFIESNLVADTFINLDINIMLFADNRGRVVYGKAIDLDTKRKVPIPRGITNYLRKTGIFNGKASYKRVKGIIVLPEGPMIIASNPILTSNHEGPVAGQMVVGRFLDKSEANSLSKEVSLDIYLESMNKPADSVFQEISDKNPITFRTISNNKLAGYSIMKDIYGNKALGIKLVMVRKVYAVGLKANRYMLYSLCIFGILFTLTMLLFLERNVLSKLHSLTIFVKSIGRLGTLNRRLDVRSTDDEFGIISHEINNMLDKLKAAENVMKKAQSELEKRVAERTMELAATNRALQAEIAEREKTQAEIKYMAYYDYLTGLPNRSHVMSILKQAIAHNQNDNVRLAVMFIDIDNFKLLNDTMGHEEGDEVLRVIARRLHDSIQGSHTIARLGGDEFIVIIQDFESVDVIQIVAGKILHSLNRPIKLKEMEHYMTASIGIALHPEHGETADELIKNADIAMYESKNHGKNEFMLFTPVMKSTRLEQMQLSNDLHRALEHGELMLYYQPQISIETNEIIGVEALLRWKHSELGFISPSKFIPIAEHSGLINPIGEWVLRTACRQNKLWQQSGLSSIRMAVNLSMNQFQTSKVADMVKRILKETGLSGRFLELEITESIAMNETDHIAEILQSCWDMGVTISIYDFGTDYSSLKYLKQIPIDRIKIAMPFVSGISVNEKDEAIIKTIIVLAKSLGFAVIAEGVETKEQLDFLSEHLCDEVQGYYYYEPMSVENFEKLLRGDNIHKIA